MDPERIICLGYRTGNPARQLMAVYAGYSFLGTLMLLLPWAHRVDMDWVDHLFMAVSAISTTGLSTVDLGTAAARKSKSEKLRSSLCSSLALH